MCNFEATSKALISVNIIFQIIVKLVFFHIYSYGPSELKPLGNPLEVAWCDL